MGDPFSLFIAWLLPYVSIVIQYPVFLRKKIFYKLVFVLQYGCLLLDQVLTAVI